MAMRIIQWPKSFDVLVTENLFGDILTGRGIGDHRLTGTEPLLRPPWVCIRRCLNDFTDYPSQAAGKDIANLWP